MLITITRILIEQSNKVHSERTEKFLFNFCNNLEIESSWANLTDTAKITFPKNIFFINKEGKKLNWEGKNVIGDKTNPLLLRGDKVTISLGYIYPNLITGEQQVQFNQEFQGFITKINNRTPLKIECEDNMYALKQIQAPTKVFPKSSYDLQKIMTELISGTGFTVVSSTTANNVSTDIGDFRTVKTETVAQVLERLRKEPYHIESYFRGTELRCSGFVYFPGDAVKHKFQFQKNIITKLGEGESDSLEFKRMDDVKLGAKAYSIFEETQGTSNSYGYKNKKQKRLETFVGDHDGEIKTLYFINVPTVEQLKIKAQAKLNRMYYEGFSGTFTVFGLPSVKHGDSTQLIDPIIPEMNGTYMVKKVKKIMSVEKGFKQEITIDIRIDSLSQDEINMGL